MNSMNIDSLFYEAYLFFICVYYNWKFMQSRVRSELQMQVLKLYRQAWKFASKQEQPFKGQFQQVIR